MHVGGWGQGSALGGAPKPGHSAGDKRQERVFTVRESFVEDGIADAFIY